MSQLGFWFLRRPEGHVEMLDVFTGQVLGDTKQIFEDPKEKHTKDYIQGCLVERARKSALLT